MSSTTKSAVSFRTTYILIGAAALFLGALAIYVFVADEKKQSADGTLLESFKNLNIQPQDITSVEIDRGGEKIVLSRQSDGRWRVTQPLEARADSDHVEAIVREVLTARNDDKRGGDVTPNLATHGLDKPAAKVTLFKGERSASLSLGKTTIGGDEALIYVVSSDDPKTPHAVRKSKLKDLLKAKPPADAGTADMLVDVADLRTYKMVGEGIKPEMAAVEIEGIKLTEKTGKGERVVSLSRNNPTKTWRFVIPAGFGDVETDVPPEKRNPNMIYNLPSLINNLLAIDVPSAKDFLPGTPDLAALGLDPTSDGVLRIDVERKDAIGTETLWISKQYAKSELDKVYVRYGSDASVAEVNAEKPRMLREFVADSSILRGRTLLKLRRDRIDVVEIKIDDGKPFQLRKIDGHWKVAEGDKREGANEEVERLLQRLSQVRDVRGFPPENATPESLGLTHPKVEIKIWEDGVPVEEKPDEKKWPSITKAPTARLEFGNKDIGDVVFVRRWLGEAAANFKMPDELLTLALRGPLDYFDIALKPFDPNAVEKITVVRNGENWEFERDASNLPAAAAQWRVLAPPAHKGKLGNAQQISLILDSYKDTTTKHVVSEKAAPDQLATLGLDPDKPEVKVALKIKGEPTERVYFLGNEVKGKLNAYARTNMSDYVFEWPLAKKDMVLNARLLDPHLYQIEPANVTALKLKGWVSPAKPEEPITLEFERKPGGIWTTKGGFPLDADKVEQLFQACVHPQSREQVVEKTGPKPDQKLELKDGALEIEIIAGDAKPVTLTIGGPANKEGTTVYAMTNQEPGNVYTLDAERFAALKASPDVLKMPGKEKEKEIEKEKEKEKKDPAAKQ